MGRSLGWDRKPSLDGIAAGNERENSVESKRIFKTNAGTVEIIK